MHIDISIEFSFPHTLKLLQLLLINLAQLPKGYVYWCGAEGTQGWCHGKQMAKCFWQTAIYCRTSMRFSSLVSLSLSLIFAYYSTQKPIEMEMGMEIIDCKRSRRRLRKALERTSEKKNTVAKLYIRLFIYRLFLS